MPMGATHFLYLVCLRLSQEMQMTLGNSSSSSKCTFYMKAASLLQGCTVRIRSSFECWRVGRILPFMKEQKWEGRKVEEPVYYKGGGGWFRDSSVIELWTVFSAKISVFKFHVWLEFFSWSCSDFWGGVFGEDGERCSSHLLTEVRCIAREQCR